MKVSKFSSLGSEYIIIDNRAKRYDDIFQDPKKLAEVCDDHSGIGATGVVEITTTSSEEIEVRFYGSAGLPAKYGGTSACCATAFARLNGLLRQKQFTFVCDNKKYENCWSGTEDNYTITFQDIKRDSIVQVEEGYEVFAGCPHVVKFVKNVEEIDVLKEGKEVSSRERFRKHGGVNVNFVENTDEKFNVRTYCRSSDSELSVCGSGSVSVAVVCDFIEEIKQAGSCRSGPDGGYAYYRREKIVHYPGGTVKVLFNVVFQDDIYSSIRLILPASHLGDTNLRY